MQVKVLGYDPYDHPITFGGMFVKEGDDYNNVKHSLFQGDDYGIEVISSERINRHELEEISRLMSIRITELIKLITLTNSIKEVYLIIYDTMHLDDEPISDFYCNIIGQDNIDHFNKAVTTMYENMVKSTTDWYDDNRYQFNIIESDDSVDVDRGGVYTVRNLDYLLDDLNLRTMYKETDKGVEYLTSGSVIVGEITEHCASGDIIYCTQGKSVFSFQKVR